MRNLPFIIVACLLCLLMLAAALWSRNYGTGSLRTVQFGSDLIVTTRLAEPVAVILSVENPDGTTTPFAWAFLGDVEGSMSTGGIPFPPAPAPAPATGTIFVQFATGMRVIPAGTPMAAPLIAPSDLNAGSGGPGTAMAQIPGFNVTLNGTTRIPITPGLTPTLNILQNGAAVNNMTTVSLPPGGPVKTLPATPSTTPSPLPAPPTPTGAAPVSQPASGG